MTFSLERPMKQTHIRQLIREELSEIGKASEKKYEKIEKALDKLYEKFKKERVNRKQDRVVNDYCERRVLLSTVANLTEIPVNDLMLYFLNVVKTNTDPSLIEYHLGQVYFYFPKD
jgi:hypothetical protein